MVELLRGQEVKERPQAEQESAQVEVSQAAPMEQRRRPVRNEVPAAPETLRQQLQAAPEVLPQKDQVLQSIEGALADGLIDVYQNLPADRQPAFKKKGEELAVEIHEMIVKHKWNEHRALKSIATWLEMIPNVNVHYLRQEAKIKLDAVTDLYEAQGNAM